jgi:hypothetical protein
MRSAHDVVVRGGVGKNRKIANYWNRHLFGATKRRFERRCHLLRVHLEFRKLGPGVFAWYQFSCEGNTTGLRRAYARRRLD